MAPVTLQGIRKVYAGGFEAVRGISLAIPDGAFCVLVGPSGCGKSTLLRMIAGLEAITHGTVSIGGRVVNALDPADRDIAMVFQNYALYPHMSVADNMGYGLRNRGTPRAEVEARVREAARILDLEPYLARRPRELSGGQRQRVAMGRAIVRKPQAFLFDEPLSNLDAKLRVQMRVEIKRLQRALATTAVYVTHDQVEAMTLSDMLVVMNGGLVEQVGTPIEIYRRPATRFVAGFIGSPAMNILPGRVERPGSVLVAGRTLEVDDAVAAAAVEVGIRPEDFRLAPEEFRLAAEEFRLAAEGGGFTVAVDFVEELGATRLVHGRIGDSPVTIQVATAEVADHPTALSVTVRPGAIHLFDPATGRRIGRDAGAVPPMAENAGTPEPPPA